MKKIMKKNKKILDKVIYEESPWGDDDPVLGKPIKNLLPPAHVLKKAKVRYINESDDLWPVLKPTEVKTFRKRARKAGLTPRGLITAIVHDYLHGHPTHG